MKYFSFFFIALFFVGCQCTPTPQYVQQVPIQQSYQQPVAPVQDFGQYQMVQTAGGPMYVMHDPTGVEFFLTAALFATYWNHGGYNSCLGYYNQNRYNSGFITSQNSYRTSTKTVVNNYYGSAYDPNKPLSQQTTKLDATAKEKYSQSKGFSNPNAQPSKPVDTKGAESKGFGKSPQPAVKTETPKPVYKESKGFPKSSGGSNYKPAPSFRSGKH